jgi:hypothetical protein
MLTLSFVIQDPKQTSRPRSEALGIPARRDVMIARFDACYRSHSNDP